MMSARYDEFADWYHEWVGEDACRDFTCVATVDALGDVGRGRVLDLACGSGRVARYLADRGATVVGVDVSAALIAKAIEVERGAPRGIRYLIGDAQDTLWWDGVPFDGVTCHMGMSDIDNLAAAMDSVRTVLRPGGALSYLIVHPCHPGGGFGLPSWPPDEGYYWEGWWTTKGAGCRGRVGANHRTLSTYLNSALDAGLRIERVLEPVPPAKPPPKEPNYLLVACRKT
jgi:SAM-dependent methyltransferase